MRYLCMLAAAMVVVGCQAQRPANKGPQTRPTTVAAATRPTTNPGPLTGAVVGLPPPGGVMMPGAIVRVGTAPSYGTGTAPTPEVRRMWPTAVAPYPKGAVIAGPTYFTDISRAGKAEALTTALQPFWFLGQVIFLPVSMVIQPPWTAVSYRGEGLGQPQGQVVRK